MARGNVQRNPRRTARTAAPVLIGVALVTGASVFAASIKAADFATTIGSTFVGDYVINRSNGGSVSFGQVFVDELNTLPEVGVGHRPRFRFGTRRRRGRARQVARRSTRKRPRDCCTSSSCRGRSTH